MTDIETINKLAEVLGSSSTAAISAYTGYYIYNATTWVLVGLAIIGAALKFKVPTDWPVNSFLIKSPITRLNNE